MVEYEVGEKFLYYGNHTHLHGREGVVTRIIEDAFALDHEYLCKVKGNEAELWLDEYKMEKVHKTPDWEI